MDSNNVDQMMNYVDQMMKKVQYINWRLDLACIFAVFMWLVT
jgi:hypothetical protein